MTKKRSQQRAYLSSYEFIILLYALNLQRYLNTIFFYIYFKYRTLNVRSDEEYAINRKQKSEDSELLYQEKTKHDLFCLYINTILEIDAVSCRLVNCFLTTYMASQLN